MACGYFLFDVSLVCRDLLVLLGEHTCSTKCKLEGETGPTRGRVSPGGVWSHVTLSGLVSGC